MFFWQNWTQMAGIATSSEGMKPIKFQKESCISLKWADFNILVLENRNPIPSPR